MSSVTLLVFALVQGPELGWGSAPVIGRRRGGPAAAGRSPWIERRSRDPLDATERLLRNPIVRLAVAIAFLFMATFGSLLYFLSIYFQDVWATTRCRPASGSSSPPPWWSPVRRSRARSHAVRPAGARCLSRSPSAPSALSRSAWRSSPTAPTPNLIPGLVLSASATGRSSPPCSSPPPPAWDREQGVASGIVSTGRASAPQSASPSWCWWPIAGTEGLLAAKRFGSPPPKASCAAVYASPPPSPPRSCSCSPATPATAVTLSPEPAPTPPAPCPPAAPAPGPTCPPAEQGP